MQNDFNLHLYIHVVPSDAEISTQKSLEALAKGQAQIVSVLEKLGAGGASAADLKSLTDKAQHSATGAQNLEKSIEDLPK